MNQTYRKTRFDTLVYGKLDQGEWSFFNVDIGKNIHTGDRVKFYYRVGMIYRSEKELLADLERYAGQFYGTGGKYALVEREKLGTVIGLLRTFAVVKLPEGVFIETVREMIEYLEKI